MQGLPDVPTWAGQVVSLIGVGGLAMLLRELIKQSFGRAKDQDENKRLTRADQATQIATLTDRVDTLTTRLDEMRAREIDRERAYSRLEAENVQLRSRYHRFMSYVQELLLVVEDYHKRLGLPLELLPRIPRWLDESIPGPTASAAASAPPQEPTS